MWHHLLGIYRESQLNPGQPTCLFAETLIFNEGWLLRSVLQAWRTGQDRPGPPFLPSPAGAKIYSEGQLRTPFKARFKGDPAAETHSRVDGIAGFFSLAEGTKQGIALAPGCRYVAAFEAKLYSPIAGGVKAAPAYDQVSRTAACLIHALLEAGTPESAAAHLAVLHPADTTVIEPGKYGKEYLRKQIAGRLAGYRAAGGPTPHLGRFQKGWHEKLARLAVHFFTWEAVLAEIGDEDLLRFYDLCKRFGS
jgi:hypothetical protein